MIELLPVYETVDTVIVGYIKALSSLFVGEMKRELYIKPMQSEKRRLRLWDPSLSNW